MGYKTVRVTVIAPEGRFYPRWGGRACGESYELPLADAQRLVQADTGLSLETDEPAAAKRATSKESKDNG